MPGTHPSPSKIACIGCPPGKFSLVGECILCTQGKYQNEMGQSKCKWCNATDFSFRGRAGCLDQCPCSSGKYSTQPLPNASLSTTCTSCVEGKRCPRYSFDQNTIDLYETSPLNLFTTCWTQDLCNTTADGSALCNPASVYCPANSTTYIIVPSGYYSTSSGSVDDNKKERTEISLCPKGHWCKHGEKTACALGKFAPEVGATSCDMCDPGKYANTPGRVNCTECPEGMQCPRGAIDPVKCGCEADRTQKMNSLKTINENIDTQECPPIGWSASKRPGDSYCPPGSGSPKYPPKGTFTSGGEDPYFRIAFMPDIIITRPTDVILKLETPIRQHAKKTGETVCDSTIEGKCVTGQGTLQGAEMHTPSTCTDSRGGTDCKAYNADATTCTARSVPNNCTDPDSGSTCNPHNADNTTCTSTDAGTTPRTDAGATQCVFETGTTCVFTEATIDILTFDGVDALNKVMTKQKFNVLIVKVTGGEFDLTKDDILLEVASDSDEEEKCKKMEHTGTNLCLNGNTIASEIITFGGGMKRTSADDCENGNRCKQGRDYICLPGTFAPGSKNSVCQSCPPGTFSERKGANDCALCPAGWFQNVPQETKCKKCAAGKYAQRNTTALCTNCPAGYYAPLEEYEFCPACELGKYQVSESSIVCKHCEAGKDSNGTLALAEGCTSCEIGKYRPDKVYGFNFSCLEKEWRKIVDDSTLDTVEKKRAQFDSNKKNCEIGYPRCMMCDAHSYGCGPSITLQPDKKFADVVKYVTDRNDLESFCAPDKKKRCEGVQGFVMDGKEGVGIEKDVNIYLDIGLKDIAEKTLDKHDTFYTKDQCVRLKGDAEKGSQCSKCDDGWISNPDRKTCIDKDRTGDDIERMIAAKEWELKSFFDGKDGDAHAMKVTLKIPAAMKHKDLKMKYYQLEVSTDSAFGSYVCKEGIERCSLPNEDRDRLSPRAEIPDDGEKYEYEFTFRLPNTTASLYEKSYYVRAFPVIEVNGNEKLVNFNTRSKLDRDGKVLSEVFPSRKWKVISDCGGSDLKYLETRTETNSFPGENIEDPNWENWKCGECPKGGACRGDSESHWRTMVALFGYWRARDLNASRLAMDNTLYAGRVKFYKCPRPWACLGRKNLDLEGRGWGRKNASYMNSRSLCCDWNFEGKCGEEYEVENEAGEMVKEIANCEASYHFKEGCSEYCYTGEYEESIPFSSDTVKKVGEICEPNPICEAPDPALIDHSEKCTDGYIGLTCGNCYSPFNDPTDPCSTDPTYEEMGVGTGGKLELLNCDRRKYFMKKGGCEVCPPPRFEVDLWVMFLMVFGILIGLYIFYKYILKRLFKFIMKYKIIFNDIKRSLSLLLDFLQVLNSISEVITIDFPPMMENFLDSFSGFIAFDVKVMMGMPCVDVGGDGITAYGQEVAIPFVFVFLALGVFTFNATRAKGLCPKFCGGRIVVIAKDTGPKVNKLKRKSLAVIRDMQKGTFNSHARHSTKVTGGSGLSALSKKFGNGIFDKEDAPAVQKGIQDLWYTTRNIIFTILTFYHVPIISKSFNMFRCEIIEGKDYLNMDYNIPCWEPRHFMGMLAACIVIVFYVFGLPFCWAYQLYRNRSKLHTPHMVKTAGYTYVMFHPRAQWYWTTLVAMSRKIVLAGGLIVLYRNKVMQITIGIIYCSFLLVILQHVRPHKMRMAHWLTTISWLGITLIYSVPLTKEAIKSSPTPGESAQAILVDYYCMGIIYSVMGAMFFGMLLSMRMTWIKFQRLQGVANFDQNDYAWLYLEEKDLKAAAARESALTAKKSHGIKKSFFSFGTKSFNAPKSDQLEKGGTVAKKNWKAKGGSSASSKNGAPKRTSGFGLGRVFSKKSKVMVAPMAPVDDDPFGLAGMKTPNMTANRKLPSHLVSRIQDRRQKRDIMNSGTLKRQETSMKIMRRQSFDASSSMMAGGKFDKFDKFSTSSKESTESTESTDSTGSNGSKKPSRRSSMKAKSSTMNASRLKRRPSAKMLSARKEYAESNAAGDLMIVQPRRQLLGRKKFKKLDPHSEDREIEKTMKKELKIKTKKELDDKRFQVFLSAAVKKGYFAHLETDSEEYKKKYTKLVSKYQEKYKQTQLEEESSSSEEDSEEDNEPRAIMLKTDMPVVNAFGKGGAELKSALLSHGLQPKYESDTMQEI